MPVFYHEKLPVYHKALEFAFRADELALKLPRERGYLKQQFWRASSSIPFTIAEGTAGLSDAARLNYFRIARGSAAECSAILDYIKGLGLLDPRLLLYDEVRDLGAMLGTAIFKHLK